MSEGAIVGWLILLLIAYAVYRHIKHRRNEKAEAEHLRALLRARIEDYRKVVAVYATKDRALGLAVKYDREIGRPTEEIEANRRRAVEAEQDGRGIMAAIVTLEEVAKQPTKTEMIALMERYVLDFDKDEAEWARLSNQAVDAKEKERIDTEGLMASIVVAILNSLLVEIKQH
jgi:hypothetical protein